MSFNNLQPSSGPFLLSPGESVDITMWYGDPGDDYGAQWIMAHPLHGPNNPPTTLQVSNFRKILGYSVESITENGATQVGWDPDTYYYQYGVTVTNLGDQASFFNIQGGGNS